MEMTVPKDVTRAATVVAAAAAGLAGSQGSGARGIIHPRPPLPVWEPAEASRTAGHRLGRRAVKGYPGLDVLQRWCAVLATPWPCGEPAARLFCFFRRG